MWQTECPSADVLSAFLSGTLADPELGALVGHLESCPACEAATAALEQLDAAQADAYRRAARTHFVDGAEIPQQIGEYQILGEIGRGGMGVVYRAWHAPLRRGVALKVLRGGALANPEARQRFRAEALAVAKLQHSNVVQVFDVGEWRPPGEGTPIPFLAFEFVPGGSLAAHIAGKPQDFRQCALWLSSLCRAAQHAHEAGIVHRDIKPANVLIGADGQLKLCDFGIAKDLDATTRSESGAIVGTAGYLAPEQIDRKTAPIGPATDVYALGVVLYELLTGRLPFTGELMAVLAAIRSEEPSRPRSYRGDMPADLEAICLKCLEKDPRLRYARAAELADDLDRFRRGESVRVRPRLVRLRRAARWVRRYAGILTAALLPLLLASILVAWAWTRPPKEQIPLEPIILKPPQSLPDYLALLAQAERDWLAGESQERIQASLDACDPDRRHWEWYYLRRKFAPPDRVVRGPHTAELRALCYSPDGSRLASGGDDGVVLVTDPDTGATLATAKLDTSIRCLTFLPTGKTLAVGGEDGRVVLWDTAGQPRLLGKHLTRVTGLALTPDGTGLLSAAEREPIHIWDLASGRVLDTWTLPEKEPTNVKEVVRPIRLATNAKNRHVAIAEGARLLVVEWAAEKENRRVKKSHNDVNGGIWSLSYSADGDRLLVGTALADVWIRDSQGGLPTRLNLQGAPVNPAWSPDGRLFATSGADGGVRVWITNRAAAHGRSLVHELRAGGRQHANAVAFRPNGTQLAVAEVRGEVSLWEFGLGRRTAMYLHTGGGLITSGTLSPDGRHIAARVSSGGIGLWDLANHQVSAPLEESQSVANMTHLEWSPDGRWVVAVTNPAQVWDARTRKKVWIFPPDPPAGPRKLQMKFSPAGDRIVSSDGNGVEVRDAATGNVVCSLTEGIAPGLAFDADGRRLAVSGTDRFTLWEIPSGRPLPAWQDGPVNCLMVAFSPDGKYLAAGNRDVVVVDCATGKRVRTILAEGDGIKGVCFSPDGRRLACSGFNGAIRLYEMDTGAVVLQLDANILRGPLCWAGSRLYGTEFLGPGGVRVWDAPGFHMTNVNKDR